MGETVDFVLVYIHPDYRDDENKDDRKQMMENLRRRFTIGMKKESLELEEERVGKYIFVKVFCSQDRLLQEAEHMRVEMPLYGLVIKNPEKRSSVMERRMTKIITGGENTDSHVTAPFQKRCLELFQDGSFHKTPIIWAALRSLLVYNILINIDIARKSDDERTATKQGLSYLLMVGAYKDAFITHEPSSLEPVSLKSDNRRSQNGLLSSPATSPESLVHRTDLRKELHKTWGRICKRQPIHVIRDYFGEKVAFYFAWVGTFITSLWVPTILGLVVFIYGLTRRLETPAEQQDNGFLHYVEILKNSSDNELTPFFAAIICLWGTIMMEIWKRRQITLAHQWHVEDFDMVEPDRSQFYGTQTRVDPFTGLPRQYYPFTRRMIKYLTSATTLLFMVMLVFISVTSVILYRVFMTVSFCEKGDRLCDLLHGTIIAAFLNTVSIMILGRVYEYIAVKLTNWENHRTTSNHNDALIIKLYAFQFANTYTSLFYTAFFRRDFGGIGILGLGEEYTDNCGDKENSNCMSLLSFQLLVLMIIKPIPKFIRDVILPWLRKWSRVCCLNEINAAQTDGGMSKQHYLLREMLKPSAEDFRLSEFTEKMIQYGYLMLFAASFPLAPLLALIFNVLDLRIDIKRLLWWNKRPTPYRDNDIGIWFQIINFINVCAVISNGFLIAFNSELGRDQPLEIKFAIIIGFEHFVFLMKFGISLLIPDTPTWVKNSQRKERFLISRLMSQWKLPLDAPGNVQKPSSSTDHEEEEGVRKHVCQSHSVELNMGYGGTKREDLPKSRWSYG